MSDANALDAAALGPYLEAHVPGFCRPAGHRKIQRRPVQPDLSADGRKRALCAARQAAGPVAQIRASGRPRIPRHEGACRQRRAGAEGAAPLREDDADRPHVLRHGVSSTAASSGTRHCRRLPTMPSRAAIYDAMNATLAALHDVDVAARRPRPISASRATISNASSAAGPASTAPPKPSRSPTWTG